MRRLFTIGVSAAMMALLVQVLAAQGYSCSFTNMKAAYASGELSDWVSPSQVCMHLFGHGCGQAQPARYVGSRPGGLDQAFRDWEARGRGMVSFLCN